MRFKYSDSNKRYYTLDYFYRKKFNCRVAKISLDANFSCPNIDGTKGVGGCSYCRGGSSSNNKKLDLLEQFNLGINKIKNKWPNAKYIAYFQANTNTYDSVDNLKKRFEPFLKIKDVLGITIATRPDAISKEVYDYLEDLNKRTYLTIELGLQTIHDKTAKLINRCSTLKEFENCFKELSLRNINTVVHIINGLPGETKEDMLNTVRYLDKLNIKGIKIHMLFLEKNTKMTNDYLKKTFSILTRDEYIDIVCDQLEILNENVVIHRITGDPEEKYLVEPSWILNKVDVLNHIDMEMERRQTIQGFNHSIMNYVKRELENHISYNNLVIDATLGNGYDSLYMTKLAYKGKVFAFDIQEEAIINSQKLFKDNKLNNVIIFHKSHEHLLDTLKNYQAKISLIIFNLGYLPGGNKNITTNYKTTIKAINDSLKLLNNKGIILIVIYKHQEGLIEEKEILKFLNNKNIKYQEFHNTDNQKAPYLIKISN